MAQTPQPVSPMNTWRVVTWTNGTYAVARFEDARLREYAGYETEKQFIIHVYHSLRCAALRAEDENETDRREQAKKCLRGR